MFWRLKTKKFDLTRFPPDLGQKQYEFMNILLKICVDHFIVFALSIYLKFYFGKGPTTYYNM